MLILSITNMNSILAIIGKFTARVQYQSAFLREVHIAMMSAQRDIAPVAFQCYSASKKKSQTDHNLIYSTRRKSLLNYFISVMNIVCTVVARNYRSYVFLFNFNKLNKSQGPTGDETASAKSLKTAHLYCSQAKSYGRKQTRQKNGRCGLSYKLEGCGMRRPG